MDFKLSILLFICYFQGIENLIIPDELPSLLSVIYSQIPPIKKGTDSRVGWGFRLGDHADFQFLVELGPQTNTKPLNNEGDKNNKRNAENNLRNILYAQSQLLKQKRKEQQKISNTEGGKWIQSWSNHMNNESPNENFRPIQTSSAPTEYEGEIDAKLVIPEELEELYGKAKNSQQSKNVSNGSKKLELTTIRVSSSSTSDSKDALDNVDLE